MPRSTLYAGLFALLGLATAQDFDNDCGGVAYDPENYVCHNDNFLCPIVAGEPLSYCNGACYSTFMYTCTDGALSQLARHEGAFTLTVSNPAIEADGWPVTACGQHLGLATVVPGGQQYYLDPEWFVGYTQAHSAYVPPAAPSAGSSPSRTAVDALVEERVVGGAGEGCFAVNLKVTPAEGGAAWQYS
ncbi:unnamed protein product [Parascedosporium putredinis]|uniref:Endo-1,3(4)-beta-glucanase 1 carbohydrate binding domain-containing protein n=1 Tax=Parascedosporium putredinis TaxID=1442378 RepID=A0A9P1M934_9PEZI|nr:unnamed protein product [Parascedosporium putredinis]CAI7991129.1 unnamed protein product [Parascedosporium putredinis]